MLALLPLAAAAAEPAEAPRIFTFDVAAGGTLAALCGAAAVWLANRTKSGGRIKAEVDVRRDPPLGEDVARTYATKEDLAKLDAKVTTDIAALRISISENDRRAEERARGTHARIDQLYKESQKTNRSLGMLTGMLVGGKCNASVFIEPDEG